MDCRDSEMGIQSCRCCKPEVIGSFNAPIVTIDGHKFVQALFKQLRPVCTTEVYSYFPQL